MIIEMLGEQYDNQEKFHNDVVKAYKYLRDYFSIVEIKREFLVRDFDNWHPENFKYLNDTWKVIDLLEHFCYWSSSYDLVLYDIKGIRQEKDVEFKVIGIGLNFAQGVCNLLINISEYLQSDEYKFKNFLKANQTN